MKKHWLNREEYPFQPHCFPVLQHRMHYIDERQGPLLFFVHGTPSWSFDFRHCIKSLRHRYRCVAVDHMGFGLSDKPEHYDYSTRNHSLTLERFILEKDLKGITLVVHDFGGPIGLNVAIAHPERIKRIVVLNSWMWSSEQDPAFLKMKRVLKSPLLPFLYRYLNFSPHFILPAAFGEKKLPSRLRKQYTRSFAKPSERNGALAFAHSLLNDQAWFQTLWDSHEPIASKPALFIWGMKDPVIPPYFLDKFCEGFQRATVVRLPACGHFPQEEADKEVLMALREFIQRDS